MAAEDYSEEELGQILMNSLRIEEPLYKYRKYSFAFQKFSEEIKQKWLAEARLENKEIPIYGSFRSEKHWVLATTRRITWVDFFEENQRHSLKYSEISIITAVGFVADPRYPENFVMHIRDKCMIPGKPPENYREKFLKPPYNELMLYSIINPWLLIGDKKGNFYETYVEPGAVVGGTLTNLFKLMTDPKLFERVREKTTLS